MSFASDMNCGGIVENVMADNHNCNGNMAFRTAATKGKWMCTKSPEAGSLVLAVALSKGEVGAYIEKGDIASCPELPHYREISYVFTK